MSILITGGTGSLGACLAKTLLDEGLGDNMVLFDYRPDYERVAEFTNRVEIVSGNIADWPDVVRTIKEYEIRNVFHLAALLFTESMEKPYASFKINLEGTVNLLEAARMYSIEKVKAYLPDAPLNFAKDLAAPPLAIPLSYDDTSASEEFGWEMKYDLDAMIADFILEVQREEEMKRGR
jgi:nucleoside-diphosphate-sugar epimerase